MKTLNAKEFFALVKDTYSAWSEDRAPRLGAALAYYTVFSIAPLLIVAVGVAGLFFHDAALTSVKAQIKDFMGENAANMVGDMIVNVSKAGEGRSLVATLIGGATILLGAGGLFAQLQDALNTIWGVKVKPNQGIMLLVRQRFLSFAMVLGVGFTLIVSLALSALLEALAGWINNSLFGGSAWLFQILNVFLSFAIILLMFAAMFKVLPDAEIQWHDVWIGAAVTSFLFTVGKFALGWYLARPGVESAFGAAGALVVILLWVYYAAQILFFGAEFTKAYANKYGSHIVPSSHAEAVSPEARAQQGLPALSGAGAATASATGKIILSSERVEPNTPHLLPIPDKKRQDFEHALAVVGGAILAILWFARRQRED